MTLKEFNEKISQLKAEGLELAKENKLPEAEAKRKEIEKLEADFASAKEQFAESNVLDKGTNVPDDMQNVQKLGEENENMEKIYDASSVEYKNAFLKMISGREDQITEQENTAYIHTTQNTDAVLPTTMLNEIWDLVSKEHSIVGDVTTHKTGTVLEIVKHTEVVKGKAAKQTKANEGKAPTDDEQNTFVKVVLSGNDFSKSVELSYAEAEMSIDALEKYLITEIASSLGDAIADDMVSTIESGVAAANVLETATANTITYDEIAGAFAALKRAKNVVVYCTRATIYNRLATLKDTAGHLIFVPSANEDADGRLLGAIVKVEDSVADDKLLIGDPKKVVNNVITDVLVETDKDIKAHKYIYSGYERSECSLIDDKAFATLTVKATS